jgi:hypothetical protein
MFCRNRGMQLPHIHQPVFETDGAQLYKKRAKPKKAVIFFDTHYTLLISQIISTFGA